MNIIIVWNKFDGDMDIRELIVEATEYDKKVALETKMSYDSLSTTYKKEDFAFSKLRERYWRMIPRFAGPVFSVSDGTDWTRQAASWMRFLLLGETRFWRMFFSGWDIWSKLHPNFASRKQFA